MRGNKQNQNKKKQKKVSWRQRVDDVALAVFTVALVVAAVFAVLGELTIAMLVLLGTIGVGVMSLLLRATNQGSSSGRAASAAPVTHILTMAAPGAALHTAETALDERRRRILSAAGTAVLKLGVIGFGSTSDVDEAVAARVLSTLLVDLQVTSRKRLVVVTAWAAEGVALVAFNEARRLGLPTVGFGNKLTKQDDSRKLDCDEVYVVGRNAGDETLAFLTFIDGLALMGGSSLADRRTFDEFRGPKFDLSSALLVPPPPQVRNVDD